jgi:hypothetical protein
MESISSTEKEPWWKQTPQEPKKSSQNRLAG